MTYGYLTASEITSYFSSKGWESIVIGTTDFDDEFQQAIWRLCTMFEAAAACNVYIYDADKDSVKVAPGRYQWKGTETNYTGSSETALTDDDVNYIWMDSENVAHFGVDGDGWPDYPHLKIAEVTMSGGIITAITDRRPLLGLRNDPTYADIMVHDGDVVCYNGEVVTID